MEDFPPPDEFKPFQKIYPSKIARGKCVNRRISDNDPIGLQIWSEHKKPEICINVKNWAPGVSREGWDLLQWLQGPKKL